MNHAAKYLENIRSELDDSWLPQVYRRVLKLRTRAYEFPPMPENSAPQIHHTLLGIELKVGRRRMLCPDLATARYLSVFARIGCRAVAIPYDITKISMIADELDGSWHRMLLISDRLTADRNAAFRARIQRQIIGKVRDEIGKAGASRRGQELKESTTAKTDQQRG